MKFYIAALAILACAAAPAYAAQVRYAAELSGLTDPTDTESTATGAAEISVDTTAQTIDAHIVVHGITLAQLSTHLAHAPVGPMHLHLYAENGDVSLLMPFPTSAGYAATSDGFEVNMHHYAYAEAAATVQSNLSFNDFLAALAADPVYLNIHTEAFPEGEISGALHAAS